MSGIGYTDKFRRLGREYMMQTSVNELDRNIVSSLFHSGQLISHQIFPISNGMAGSTLLNEVSKIHERCLKDFDFLLGLVERVRGGDKPEIIEKLGKALYARQLYDEGQELLILATQKFPDKPGLHFALGKLYLGKGLCLEAADELSKAVELAPNFPDYRNLLGLAYLKSHKPVIAIDEFKKAVELNIYYYEAYFNLGLGFILNGIVREDFNLAKNLLHNSLEAFQKAILFNPGYVSDRYQMGLALLQEGKLEPAFDLLSRIPDETPAHSSEEKLLEMYLRYIHGEEGMTEEGISQYVERISELLKANPGHADLHNELGMAFTVLSKFMNNKAIHHFKEALRLNPNFMKAAKNLKLSQNDLKGFEVLLEAIVK